MLLRGINSEWVFSRDRKERISAIAFCVEGELSNLEIIINTLILWKSDLNFDLDYLLKRGTDWVRDYLMNNPNVSESDRELL